MDSSAFFMFFLVLWRVCGGCVSRFLPPECCVTIACAEVLYTLLLRSARGFGEGGGTPLGTRYRHSIVWTICNKCISAYKLPRRLLGEINNCIQMLISRKTRILEIKYKREYLWSTSILIYETIDLRILDRVVHGKCGRDDNGHIINTLCTL